MIINTRRPASILIIDTFITAAAWLAFIYQFTKGVIFMLSEHPRVPLSPFSGISFSPTATTLVVCTAVCLFNATLVYAWARWHKTRHIAIYDDEYVQSLPSASLADHFSLSPQQLNNVRDSRVTVVYHSPSGGITHLETGDLQLQQVIPPLPEAALRVA